MRGAGVTTLWLLAFAALLFCMIGEPSGLLRSDAYSEVRPHYPQSPPDFRILFSNEDLRSGQELQPRHFETVFVPSWMRKPSQGIFVSDMHEVIGRTLNADLARRQPLTADLLTD